MIPLLSRPLRAAACLLAPLLVATPGLAGGAGHVDEIFQARNWTTRDGLPQNTVRDILQARDGYLWFATLDGLVRFDGVLFRVFNRDNTPGLASNRFLDIDESPDGALWCGTEDGGLSRFEGTRFTSWSIGDGLPGTLVRGVQVDSTGRAWAATLPGVVEVIDSQVRAVPMPADATPAFGAGPGRGAGFCEIRGNEVIRIHRGIEERFVPVPGDPAGRVLGVSTDQHGCFWVGTAGAGLFQYRGGQVRRWTAGLPGGPVAIRCALDDRRGNLWLATADDRVGLARNGAWLAFPAGGAFPASGVSVFHEDREGSIWVGSNAGLHQLTQRAIRSFSVPEGLSGAEVYPMLEDRAGRIWIGTSAAGLNRIEAGRVTVHDRVGDRPMTNISSLAEDRRGRIWIGTYGQGLFRLDGGRFDDLTAEFGLTDESVRDIFEDERGVFWVATSRGLLRGGDGPIARFDRSSGFLSDDVRVLCPSRSGNLWIGCYGGLARWDGSAFRTWTESDGLVSSQVRALREDEAGRLWIGSYDRGLGCFHEGRFTTIGTRQGLGDAGVFQVLDDGRGFYWFSSNRGIHRTPRRELEAFVRGEVQAVSSLRFDTRDGMRNAECNGGRHPAGFRARDGRLWFPTVDGAAIVDPAEALPPPGDLRVLVEEVRIDNRPVRGPTAPLVIEPGQTHLELHYSSPTFLKPDQVRFRYRLAGLEADWTEAGPRRSAIFTHLPAGTYEFQVLAATATGEWGTAPTRLTTIVRPPFWQRGWFLGLSALLVAGALAGGLVHRRRRIVLLEETREEFARKLLRSQEAERKRIAGALHDGLGQTLVIIKNRALMGLGAAGDEARIRDQLAEISEAASHGLTEVREMAFALRPHHLDQLGLSRAIKSLVEKAGTASGIAIDARVEPVEGLLSSDVETALYRIVQEAVSNILKHSGAARARVELLRTGNSVRLVVADEGRGLPATIEPPTGGRRSGRGLPSIGERVRLLGGRHRIDSTPGTGTMITVWFDL